MADPKKQLESKFQTENRFNNFGESLRKITINGFRGIEGLEIEFHSPIIAISGLNGAGKSTIGQICLSGYRKPTTTDRDYKRFYVRDFFPASAADPNPFHQNSEVIFEYETPDHSNPQKLTVKRADKEWSGYKRQPFRKCFYIGFTIYIPKVERKDLSIYKGSSFALTEKRDISDDSRVKVGRILGQQYDELHFQGIRHGRKNAELGIASRFSAQYSENNMGFGEGRTLYMVDLMESAPEKSLFVIEEPETSLHEHAEHELAKYFIDVCNRKSHQIILTTHSDRILNAIPSESRIMLYRDSDGVSSYEGLSATRARSMLSLGVQRGLTVFVEDDFAQLLLSEMISTIDAKLLSAINIEPVGDTKAVRNATLLMRKIGKNAIAVRDADIGPDVPNGIYSFPGSMPPEKEVYSHKDVISHIQSTFSINIPNVIARKDIKDHHKYTEGLATEANKNMDYFRIIAIQRYIESIGLSEYSEIVESIRRKS